MAHAPVELADKQKISPAQLKDLIQQKDTFLIDVRNASEIEQQGGYIKSKRRVNIPLPELDEALNLPTDSFKSKYGVEKPEGDGSDVVFHCFLGRRGGVAVQQAEKAGLKNSKNLVGGFKSWLEEGLQK